MAFTQPELDKFLPTITEFVEALQPPPEIRDKLRYELETSGQSFSILSVRPAFMRPGEESRQGIARLRWVRTSKRWTLYWMRQDLRWHTYPEARPSPDLKRLLDVVRQDAFHCFFG